jgi:hypothetical protein
MQRNKEKLKSRRDYVRRFVGSYRGLTKDAVKELADRLFLSENTIWKDLLFTIKTENGLAK